MAKPVRLRFILLALFLDFNIFSISFHLNLSTVGGTVKLHVAVGEVTFEHPCGRLLAEAEWAAVVNVKLCGTLHCGAQFVEFGTSGPAHAPDACTDVGVRATCQEERRKVCLERRQRVVAPHVQSEYERQLLPRVRITPLLHLLLAVLLVVEHRCCVGVLLSREETPGVRLCLDDGFLGGGHSNVVLICDVEHVLVREAHVDLVVLVDLGWALDGVVARPVEEVRAPEVVDEEPVDVRVAQRGVAEDVLNEEVAQHGSVPVVPEVLPTGVLPTVADVHTAAIGVRLLRCRLRRGLLLVVVERTALPAHRVASRHVVRPVHAIGELQKETTVGRVVQLGAHSAEPGQSLHKISVDEDVCCRVACLCHARLCDEALLTVHGLLVCPLCLGVAPVEGSNTELS